LSKTLIDRIVEAVRAQVPLWACELTSRHVIVAGVNRQRNKVRARLAAGLRTQGVTGSLTETNIANKDATRSAVLDALNEAGFEGSEIAVIVPDDAVRIAFLTVEKLSKDPAEQQTFIRWKFKKSVPFDVESAQVAFRLLGTRPDGSSDLLVTFSPRAVIEEYENLFDSMDIHAGLVIPSTLAALNLFTPPPADALFLKIAPACITTTIFQQGRMQFYRRVIDASVYEAVYPTLMYYQDKLGGNALGQLVVCGYDADLRESLQELQEKLGLRPEHLKPMTTEDIFKPALGGVHCEAI